MSVNFHGFRNLPTQRFNRIDMFFSDDTEDPEWSIAYVRLTGRHENRGTCSDGETYESKWQFLKDLKALKELFFSTSNRINFFLLFWIEEMCNGPLTSDISAFFSIFIPTSCQCALHIDILYWWYFYCTVDVLKFKILLFLVINIGQRVYLSNWI